MQNSVYDVNNNQRILDINLNSNLLMKKESKISDAEKSDLTTNSYTNNLKSVNEIYTPSPNLNRNLKSNLSEFSDISMMMRYEAENIKESNPSLIKSPYKAFDKIEENKNQICNECIKNRKFNNLNDLTDNDNKKVLFTKVRINIIF